MSLTGLDRKISKLDESMDYLRRQKAAEERAAWRRENSDRLKWEMFLRNHGPSSIEWTEEDIKKYTLEEEDIKAGIACRAIMQRVLAKYKDGWQVDYAAMDETEKAFAFLLEEFNIYVDFYNLLERDFENLYCKLGLDEARSPFLEVLKAVDAHMGGSDWREVCYRQEAQDRFMMRLFENYEAGRANYLRHKAEEQKAEETE